MVVYFTLGDELLEAMIAVDSGCWDCVGDNVFAEPLWRDFLARFPVGMIEDGPWPQ